ncbi:MAG: hypothetical protein KAI79_08995 [Bacteroidales bacterium]|nr:hypothetical protein [Bacteroidales bacterium]
MTVLEKIEKLIDSDEGIILRYDGLIITEIDYEDKVFLTEDGDSYQFDEIFENVEYLEVFELKEYEFPEDIFELATLFKKMLKVIEDPKKERIILTVNEMLVNTEESLLEHSTIYELSIRLSDMELFYKVNIKGYFD